MKWVQKDPDITVISGAIIDSLDSDSIRDTPSINTVNKEISAVGVGRVFRISRIPGESVTLGNYDEGVAAGKPAALSDFN